MVKGYLAGPMRGYPQFNFPLFDAAAALLRGDGHEVISPAEHDRESGFDEVHDDESTFDLRAAILWDLKVITESEVVWLLPGWQRSAGCRVEVALADLLGIPTLDLSSLKLSDWKFVPTDADEPDPHPAPSA